jgi:hypothetical protein
VAEKGEAVPNLPVPVPVSFSKFKLETPDIAPLSEWEIEIISPSGLTLSKASWFKGSDKTDARANRLVVKMAEL